MNLLPRFSFALVVSHFALVTITVSFALVVSHFALVTPVHAASPPDPKPCEEAVDNAPLTDQSIEPETFTVHASGVPGQTVHVSRTISVNIDFSKLQAIFGKANSNYLEAKFQDEPHRTVNLSGLQSADFNQFYGPAQKTTPKVLLDMLKVKYVNYVYNKPHLAESANKYTDINGSNPQTIYDLVSVFGGLPNPPEAGQNRDIWNQTWGKYWEKIPTEVSEFYYGQLIFVEEDAKLNQCMPPLRTIYFVMPEFARTNATSEQLNQVIVPKAAQSSDSSLFTSLINQTKNLAQKCLKPFTENPISKNLKKAVKISLSIFQPVKNVYAANDCSLLIQTTGKEGSAPFCALPALAPDGTSQLLPGDSCSPASDSTNQLDKNNPNVNCTFRVTWSDQKVISSGFDSCSDDDGDGVYDCSLHVKIYPTFRIPWLAEIWNHTLYSDEGQKYVNSQQETGRPGIYSSFTPLGSDAKNNADVLQRLNNCLNDPSKNIIDCQAIAFEYRILPGQTTIQSQNENLKERFIGATDCGKEFVRDIALKPKALQEHLNINSSSQCGASTTP